MNFTFTTGLVYDVLLLVLVLLVALRGKHKGLLAGVLGLVGSIAGILAAVWATRQWSPLIYTNYLGPALGQRVADAMEQSGGDLQNAVQALGFLPESLQTTLLGALQNATDSAVPAIVNALQPVLLPLVQAVLFLVACLAVQLVFKLLSAVLQGFNHVPLLGTVNQSLGFAFGFVTGVFECWLVCLALWVLAGVTAGQITWLNETVLNQSVLYRFFANFNPFLVHY